jgi:hypothetical protein
VGTKIGHDLGDAADGIADARGDGLTRSLGRRRTERPGGSSRAGRPPQLGNDPLTLVTGPAGAADVVVQRRGKRR